VEKGADGTRRRRSGQSGYRAHVVPALTADQIRTLTPDRVAARAGEQLATPGVSGSHGRRHRKRHIGRWASEQGIAVERARDA
jgi:hypothetical protein